MKQAKKHHPCKPPPLSPAGTNEKNKKNEKRIHWMRSSWTKSRLVVALFNNNKETASFFCHPFDFSPYKTMTTPYLHQSSSRHLCIIVLSLYAVIMLMTRILDKWVSCFVVILFASHHTGRLQDKWHPTRNWGSWDRGASKIQRPCSIGKRHNAVAIKDRGKNWCRSWDCLSSGRNPWELCYTAGWGKLETGGNQPLYFIEASVPIVSSSDCYFAYKGLLYSSMLSAGFEEGEMDACQGDSGGGGHGLWV